MKLPLNDNWYFTEHWSDVLLTSYAGLAPVRLPHTVKDVPLNYFSEKDYEMVCGYVRPLDIPADWRNKRVFVTFGAAGHEATVYCNGVELLRHRCGYTAFTAELTEHLRFGEGNLLTVRLDTRESLDQPPFGGVIDYLCFGGLYRAVTLEVTPQQRIADVFIHADHLGNCHISAQADGPISGQIFGPTGNLLASFQGAGTIFVPNAPIWDLEHPNLCTLLAQTESGARYETQFGFRTLDFRADGLYLNEKRIQLRGLNRHQSWPYLGYAVPDRAQALDADILKFELGCNVVRTSHYPQSHAFVQRCDEIGLLVFTEIPGWQHIGGEDWQAVCLQNVREMVTEYRNHPSIFIWGVRINESQDHDTLYAKTNTLAHALDPSRPTGGVRYLQKSGFLEDVYTFNDFIHDGRHPGCRPKSENTPDMTRGYMVTEYNGHMFPTKSYDHEGKRLEHALRHCRVLNDILAHPDIAGCTGWCMFDYNTHADFGSGDRICYHGVLDPFRNHKLAAAAYAAEGCTEPVLVISSNMDIGDHPGGGIHDIYAFTNADVVELYKGDTFIAAFRGSKEFPNMAHGPVSIDDRIGSQLDCAPEVRAALNAMAKYWVDDLPRHHRESLTRAGLSMDDAVSLFGRYMTGWGDKHTTWNFRALKDGREVAFVSKGAVESVHLEAKSDTLTLQEHGTWDMATIRFRALDQRGNVLPYCSRVVLLEVTGPVEIVGPTAIALSGGMGGTYLRTTGQTGKASLTLTCQSMEPVTLEFVID